MEELLGIIIFIFFVLMRAMADRKRGMKKEPTKPRTRPAPAQTRQPVRPPVRQPVPQAKPAREKPRPEMPPFEPVAPLVQYGEGESAYETLPYMEGSSHMEREESAEAPAPSYAVEQVAPVRPVLTADDIRKAVIWSEVLQKPRFRTGYRRNVG